MPEIGQIYFAAVDLPAASYDDAIHSVEDETLLRLKISQSEGEFATAEVEIENPGEGLLSPTRKKRCFISIENPSGSPKLIFAGRLVGYPTDVTQETVTLQYVAQPDDWEVLQQALVDSLKVAPYYNELFVAPDKRNDPAEVLAGRTALLYWDRVDNTVAISDIVEDGTLYDRGQIPFFDSIQVDIGDPPVSQVQVNIETQWNQSAVGVVDAATAIKAEFSGPAGNQINTLTPYSFEDAWNGLSLPAGYSIRESRLSATANSFGLVQADLATSFVEVNASDFPTASGGTAGQRQLQVPRIFYEADLTLDAVYQQKRTETAEINITALTQEIALKSNEVKQVFLRIQNPTEEDQGAILDPKKPSFFWDIPGVTLTTDGREAIEHGLARGRAIVTKAARIVETTFEDDLRDVIDLTVNDTVRFEDSRFPGGFIRGKVVSYAFSVDVGRGYGAEITIASMIGTGVDSVGTGGLDETEVLTTVYNNEFGSPTMTSALFYTPQVPTINEPIDTELMTTDDQYLIDSVTVDNPGDSQVTGFEATSLDAMPAGDGRPDNYLNNNPTGVTINLKSMNPDKRIASTVVIDVEDYTLPKGTDLEA